MRTYHPHVERKGRIFQIVYRWWGMGQVLEDVWEIVEGKPKKSKRPSSYGRQSLTIAKHIARCHDNVGVITYKALAPIFIEEFGVDNVQWFGNIRGTNKLEECDGLIIFGQNSPASQDVIDHAAMLNPERLNPFHAIDDDEMVQPWGPIEMNYQLTDEGREAARQIHGADLPSRYVSGFNDSDLWNVFEQICVAELTQAIHRNRILLHENHAVWVFSPMPLLDTAVDWIADNPPLMPERWLEGKYERENPLPFWRWLDLEEWGIWDRGVDGMTYEQIAEGAGVTTDYARNDQWIDKLAKCYPDLFEVTAIKTTGRGRPPRGLRSTRIANSR